LLFLALAVLAVSGCSTTIDHELVGVWVLDQADDLADRVGQKISAIDPASASGNQTEAPPETSVGQADPPPMQIEFSRTGQLTTATRMGGIQSDKQGTWSVKSAGPPLVIAFEIAGQPAETEIEWIGADRIKMVPPNMAGLTMKLVFRKRQ
jgi:hypothetical protein